MRETTEPIKDAVNAFEHEMYKEIKVIGEQNETSA